MRFESVETLYTMEKVIIMNKHSVLEKSILTAVILAALTGGVVLAKSELTLTDTDGDGVISAEEIMAVRQAHKASVLAEFDVDGNGELSRAERRAMQDARYESAVGKYDADGDGELSRDERRTAKNARRANIERMLDVNGDGVLSDEETVGMDQLKEQRGDRKHGSHGAKHGQKGGDRAEQSEF